MTTARPLFLLMLLGCGTTPPAELPAGAWITDCPDAACREVWLLERSKQPAVVERALGDVASPEERIALVRRIFDEHAMLPQQICETLPAGDAQDWCHHLSDRPHLHQRPRTVAEPDARREGPANSELDCIESVPSAVSGLSADHSVCRDATDARACRSVEASRRAKAGALLPAASACLGIEAGRWQAECLFSAAEDGVRAGGVAVYAVATELCIASAPYRQHCQSHLISALTEDTPPPTAPPARWAQTRADAAGIQAAWAGRDDRMGALAADRFWSEALYRSYSYPGAAAVGTPISHLPEAAHPHVRAALTWRLVAEGPRRSWEAWQADAAAAMQDQAVSQAEGTQATASLQPVQDLWGRDRGDDARIPATFYLSTTRRARSDDPAEDLQICLLEALARDQEALRIDRLPPSPLPLVAWTAERLGRR